MTTEESDDDLTRAAARAFERSLEGRSVDLDALAREFGVNPDDLRERYGDIADADLLSGNHGADESIEPGVTTLGDRFRVDGVIGRGGMGVVYAVTDTELARRVAVKVVRNVPGASDADVIARFEREARIAGSLEHPNIAPVYHVGRTGAGRPFLVMKRIDGVTLDAHAAEVFSKKGRGVSPWREIASLLVSVASAIEFAHDRGVVHRDLKPGNVLVGRFREALVVDWGLAKAPSESEVMTLGAEISSDDPSLSLSGMMLGTPAYLAPEQARDGVARVGPWTDVFGMGAILFHLLTGRAPFHATSRANAMERARTGRFDVAAISRRGHGIPHELAGIATRALAERPEGRYGSMAALREDLEAYLDGRPGTGWRDPFHRRATKLVARRPATALALATVPVLFGAGKLAWDGVAVVRATEAREVTASWERAEVEIDEIRTTMEGRRDPWGPILDAYLEVFSCRGVDLEALSADDIIDEMTRGRLSSPPARRAAVEGIARLLHGLLQDDWAYAAQFIDGRRVSTLLPDGVDAPGEAIVRAARARVEDHDDGERWVGLWQTLSTVMGNGAAGDHRDVFRRWSEALEGDVGDMRRIPSLVLEAGASDQVALWAMEMCGVAFTDEPEEAIEVWRALVSAHRGSFAVNDKFAFAALHGLAGQLRDEAGLNEAKEALIRASALRPDANRIWNNLSNVYNQLGEHPSAIRAGRNRDRAGSEQGDRPRQPRPCPARRGPRLGRRGAERVAGGGASPR